MYFGEISVEEYKKLEKNGYIVRNSLEMLQHTLEGNNMKMVKHLFTKDIKEKDFFKIDNLKADKMKKETLEFIIKHFKQIGNWNINSEKKVDVIIRIVKSIEDFQFDKSFQHFEYNHLSYISFMDEKTMSKTEIEKEKNKEFDVIFALTDKTCYFEIQKKMIKIIKEKNQILNFKNIKTKKHFIKIDKCIL